jgi:hypothetical protein
LAGLDVHGATVDMFTDVVIRSRRRPIFWLSPDFEAGNLHVKKLIEFACPKVTDRADGARAPTSLIAT